MDKFTVKFDDFTQRLGSVKPKLGVFDEVRKSNIYTKKHKGHEINYVKPPQNLDKIIKICDNNPVCLIYNKDEITKIINKLYKNKYLPRFMTITIAPNMNIYHMNDNTLIECKYETKLWELVFNKLKHLGISFAGCLEHHKNRPVKHAHIIYCAKNFNRIRILKKSLKDIIGKTYTSIKDDLIQSGTHEKVQEYITKLDENNINKATQQPEHKKEYIYYLVEN